MMPEYDAIVIGAGGMGSAALYHLPGAAGKFWGWSSSTFPTKWALPTAIRG